MGRAAAALDFGTSKIAFVYGKKDAMGLVTVAGAAVEPYGGFRDDVWLDAESLPDAISRAHRALELQVNKRIQDVYVALPGDYVRVYFREISCRPSGENGAVTPEDLQQLSDQVMEFTYPDNMRLLNRQVVYYLLDSELIRTSPIMMTGDRLTMYVSIVMGDSGFMSHVEELLASLGLGVIGFVASPTAEAKLISTYQSETATSVVLDTGHFSTDIMVMDSGEPIYHTVLPVGGDRLEHDLSAIFRIPKSAAALIKKRVALGLDAGETTQTVDLEDGESYEYSLDMAQQVVEARLEDTLRRIQKMVNGFGITLDGSVHIYLTGNGFASIRGAREFMSQKTGTMVRLFQPQTPMTPSPSMTCAVGVLSYVLQEGLREAKPSLMQAIKYFFKEYF